jgi:hypothetical protein
MKKINTLFIIFTMITISTNAQLKQFATKQEAENFIVETIKKLTPGPFKFSEYKDGAIFFKNPGIEKIDEVLNEGTSSEAIIAGKHAKKIKCNAYSIIYLSKVTKLRIDTLSYPDKKMYYKYSFEGENIGETCYIPLKSTAHKENGFRNRIVFLDKTEGALSEREGLPFMGDSILENDFLQAVKVYLE